MPSSLMACFRFRICGVRHTLRISQATSSESPPDIVTNHKTLGRLWSQRYDRSPHSSRQPATQMIRARPLSSSMPAIRKLLAPQNAGASPAVRTMLSDRKVLKP